MLFHPLNDRIKRHFSNLYKDEISALKTWSNNKDLIIQKSGKGNSIVLIIKSENKMYNILSYSKQIVKSFVLDDKYLNLEKKLTDLLKELKASETVSEIVYKKLNQTVPVLVLYMTCAKPPCPQMLFGPKISIVRTFQKLSHLGGGD